MPELTQEEQARIENVIKTYEDKQREQFIQEEINRRIAESSNLCAE